MPGVAGFGGNLDSGALPNEAINTMSEQEASERIG
jgi:hypothetical protein